MGKKLFWLSVDFYDISKLTNRGYVYIERERVDVRRKGNLYMGAVYMETVWLVLCVVTVVTDTCGNARSTPFADDILIK